MNEVYNEKYYREYDVGIGKVNYEHSEYTFGFLKDIAKQIVEDLHPKSVLDAGCAMGHLVASLRDLGVEAYGIDISEYAISKVRDDIRPYCVVGSIAESLPAELPQKYDLVVTIEVLEHLYPEEGKKAIQNLCSLTERVLFSSSPDDFTEKTHVNVQQREYWARLFAEEGFFDDINYRPVYLTSYASYFKKSNDILRIVEDYERNIRLAEAAAQDQDSNLKTQLEDKDRHIRNQEEIIAVTESALEETRRNLSDANAERIRANEDLAHANAERIRANEELAHANGELAHYREHYFAAINQREELKADVKNLEAQLVAAQNDYAVIANSACWKITKPIRVFLDFLKRIPFFLLVIKAIKCLKDNGVAYTWKKIIDKLRHRKQVAVLAEKQLYTAEELEKQKEEVFSKKIKFSIVVPLYNTPEVFLKEMIQSVLDQTYSDWELCMADGSDTAHEEVGHICRSYARKDKRIKYLKLEKNLGISGNTNACLAMATGEYIGLFDHDDLLHPAALYEVMHAVCDKDADFIYTDENTFHKTPDDAYCPNFKPDYAPDTLRSYNYICHFSVFSKVLLEQCGGVFRSEFDGSQDYDLILRLTEKASRIVHIPKILYYWRSHEASVASSIEAKPYTLVAAKKALSEHLERIGLKGEVQDARIPSTYHIQYEIEGNPLISILIPNKDHKADLEKCINSIRERSTYQNWEIIVIENNSAEKETFDFYAEIERDSRIRVVIWKNGFNYSAINIFGSQYAKGEHLLLLNNDIEVITPDWIEQMLMFSQRKDVGAVGAMLYYPDDTVQHAGVILGIGGVGGHAHKYFKRGDYGYMSRMAIAQNLSAVTAACMMLRKDVWEQVHGLDESFEVAFNDVDFCMRIRQAGYLIVWTPFAELYHYESKSRGLEDTPEKRKRFEGEVLRFQARWAKELEAGDPYYNPNLSLTREDFSNREEIKL